MRIPLAKHLYQSRSIPMSAQRLVNYYYEPPPEGGKSPEMLIGTPGLPLFLDLGSDRIWGMYGFGSYLYVVSGNNAYAIDQFGGANNLGSIGTVSDVVLITDNGTNVIITKEEGDSWLATPTTLAQITDAQYQSASSCAVLNFYAVFTKLNSSQFFISALNDASSYDALDFATAEQNPDNLVRVITTDGELWFFGQKTIEIWRPKDSGFPFRNLENSTIQRGCAAKRAVAQEDNTVFWLGDDRIIYRADGYRPKRISTHAIEKLIEDMTTISDAEAFVYTQEGHKFLVVTFPTELVTICYDIATGYWHQRQSFNKGRWRATGHAFIFDKNLVGDFETGKIYELDLDYYTENGDTIEGVCTLPVVFNDDKRIIHSSLKVDFDGGFGLLTGQGESPRVMMRFSDDGGNQWSNERQTTMGKRGKYQTRSIFRRCGQSRQRVYEIRTTEPVKRNITGAFLNEED